MADQPGYAQKALSPSARNLLLKHPWPGNVRELQNTLRRLVLWTSGERIGVDEVRDELSQPDTRHWADLLGRPLGGGLQLRDLVTELVRHYLERALEESAGNKTRAAELVGLPSYQTLTNWMKTYGVKVKP
jgi:DNA-binding NtrC family response regulator